MENRLYHLLLKRVLIGTLALALAGVGSFSLAEEKKKSSKLKINSELFDVGLVAGVINIEDFPSEFVVGAQITFRASEDFFLQYNYVQADLGESVFEQNIPGGFDLGSSRSFEHYDLLVGYNLFQGEFFASGDDAHLSNLYIVGGAGDTEFGDESNFTYTIGVGYVVEFSRRFSMRVDYRDYIFRTSLLPGESEDTVHNNQFTVGVGFLF